ARVGSIGRRLTFLRTSMTPCSMAGEAGYGMFQPCKNSISPSGKDNGWAGSNVMTDDDLERRVLALIASKTKVDASAVSLDSTFDSLGLDSLDAADLLFTFEDTFHIVIPDEAAQNMKNVRQIV